MLKAIKIRLYLNEEQVNYVNNLLGTSRFIYNQLLAYKINKYQNDKENISFSQLGKKLTNLKTEHDWIKNSHSKVLQQSLIDLEKAYKNFFKNKKGFPKFKSKKNKNSCRFPSDAISGINGNRINIIKQLNNIHFKCSVNDEKYLNKYQKNIKSATLTKTKSNAYYLSILIDKPNKILSYKTDKMVGIDIGIKDFIITSDGLIFENLKLIRNNEQKIKRLQKLLSKKQIGSNNRNKVRIKLAKLYEKLNNIKENYLHLIVNKLINENQVIIIEDLNVKGMMKNHKIARSIQEISFNRFKTILKYKSEWYGKKVIEINRFYPSSKLCNVCGNKNTKLTLNVREWVCSCCGTKHDRDINAAKNVLKEGKRIIGLSSPELKA